MILNIAWLLITTFLGMFFGENLFHQLGIGALSGFIFGALCIVFSTFYSKKTDSE